MSKPDDRPLEEIQADIDHARRWARAHFNADAESDTVLDPPTFQVEFPEPDQMKVSPKHYGRPMDIWITYKLAWVDGNMIWTGTNPLTGQKLPGLKVGAVSEDQRLRAIGAPELPGLE